MRSTPNAFICGGVHAYKRILVGPNLAAISRRCSQTETFPQINNEYK